MNRNILTPLDNFFRLDGFVSNGTGNIKRDKQYRMVLILLIGIFMVANVLALGITPGRTTLDFEKNMQKSVGFDVLNAGGSDINVVFSAQGDLAKYISLPIKDAKILGSEKSKHFNYELNLPDKLGPGVHTGEVFVLQLPGNSTSEGSQILATLAVVTQVYLYVPYPGKYANSKLYIYSANVGEDVKFVIPVVSAGEFDLSSVRANVDIYNKMGEKIDSFNTNSVSVKSGTKKELVYNWKANVPIGEYMAKAAVVYDDGTINLEKSFSVGSKELELQEINVNGFSLGEIAKLNMLIENKWSESISDAYIETKIKDSDGDIVSSFQSAAQDIGALSKKSFVSYWDTAGVREGTYDAEVTINYGDKKSEKNLKFKVSKNELVVVGLGYVISAEGRGGTDGIVIVLIIVIVLLVLINLLWFFLLRKKFKS